MKAISRWQMRYLPFLVLLSCSALAVEPAPAVPQPTTLEAAAAQRQEADRMRKSAEDLFAAEQAACYKKFLVNDCLEDAKKRRTQSMIDARNLEAPARDFEREAHRTEVEGKAAQRAAGMPQRELEQKAQGDAFRAEEATRAAEREKKLADKEAQAAKGRQKAAEEQAKRKAKLEKRRKKIEESAAKRAREEAKAAEKSAAQ